MIIEKNRVIFGNANIPHSYGELNPSNFTPYPKNPNTAKVFRKIGFADELGSGVKNLYQYSKVYGGSDLVIVEGEVFNLEVQVPSQTAQENTKDKILEILRKNPKYTKADLMQILDKADSTMVKLTDSSKLHSLGWKHKLELEDGIKTMYEWHLRKDVK